MDGNYRQDLKAYIERRLLHERRGLKLVNAFHAVHRWPYRALRGGVDCGLKLISLRESIVCGTCVWRRCAVAFILSPINNAAVVTQAAVKDSAVLTRRRPFCFESNR